MRKVKLKFDTDLQKYRYVFDRPDNPYLVRLWKENNLDEIADNAKDEVTTVRRVCFWVSDKLRHNGWGYASDPLTILREAKTGKGFNCASHATLLQGCLSALGFKARTLTIMPKDIETVDRGGMHTVVETYLPSKGKWVMLDPDERIVPSFKDKSLMNAVELQKAITDNTDIHISGRYREFIYPYLFYFSCKLNNKVLIDKSKAKKIILVPKFYNVPKIIEGRWPVTNSIWTHSLLTYYQKPQNRLYGQDNTQHKGKKYNHQALMGL